MTIAAGVVVDERHALVAPSQWIVARRPHLMRSWTRWCGPWSASASRRSETPQRSA